MLVWQMKQAIERLLPKITNSLCANIINPSQQHSHTLHTRINYEVPEYTLLFSLLNCGYSSMAIPWPQELKDMMGITNAINIDLSDIFSTFKVCNFVTSFESSFTTYMLFLPAIFFVAAIAAIVLSVFDRKFK